MTMRSLSDYDREDRFEKVDGNLGAYPIDESEASFAQVGFAVDGRQFVGTTIVFCAKCSRVRTHKLWADEYWDILVRVAERNPKLYCRFCSTEIRTPVVVALAVARVTSKDAWR